MMHLIWAMEFRAISAEVSIRYHNYSRTGETLLICAELIGTSDLLIKAKCIITDVKGNKIVTASGKFLTFTEKEHELFRKNY
jgi:hypothetical protein